MVTWINKDFEETVTPYIDDIYRNTFTKVKDIIRSSRENNTDERLLFMDVELSIDTFVNFNDGSYITLQEKSLRPYNRSYQKLTMQYYKDHEKKIEGEWFKIASQFYFFGYVGCKIDVYSKEDMARSYHCTGKCHECSFLSPHIQYYIFDLPRLRFYLKNKIGIDHLEMFFLQYNRSPSKSSFFTVPLNIIPKGCIISSNVMR